jgi:hypothetical protein
MHDYTKYMNFENYPQYELFDEYPQIFDSEFVFDNLLTHFEFTNKLDGFYKVNGYSYRIILIQNNKFMKLYQYHGNNNYKIPFIIWSFEYDENMSCYREWPSNNIAKHLFYDKNGKTKEVLESMEKNEKAYDKFFKNALNSTTQLNNKISDVYFDKTDSKYVAILKDEKTIKFM